MTSHGQYVCPRAMDWYLLISIIAGSCLHEESKRQKNGCKMYIRGLV